MEVAGEVRGYHKPIMLAGGFGNISAEHTHEAARSARGTVFIQLGGPGFLIGLGGGAASSMASGPEHRVARLRLGAARQRRARAPLPGSDRRLLADGRGESHPLDPRRGRGRLSNAFPELAHTGGVGATFDLRRMPNEEPGMTPMQIWSNEAQERYVLAIDRARLADFERLCERERCPFAVVGEARADHQLVVDDPLFENAPVDMPLEVLLGKPPRMHRDVKRGTRKLAPARLSSASSSRTPPTACCACRPSPTRPSSSPSAIAPWAACARATRWSGPWQVPVADCAVTTMGYHDVRAARRWRSASARRWRSSTVRRRAAWRWARRSPTSPPRRSRELGDVKLSANWMCAAGHPGEDAALFDTVRAVGMELCPALGIAIPVGKDSMSMKTTWTRPGDRRGQGGHRAALAHRLGLRAGHRRAPHAHAAAAHRPRRDRARPRSTSAAGSNRLGGSALAQVFAQLGDAAPDLDEPAKLQALLRRDPEAQRRRASSSPTTTAPTAASSRRSARWPSPARAGVTVYLDALAFDEKPARRRRPRAPDRRARRQPRRPRPRRALQRGAGRGDAGAQGRARRGDAGAARRGPRRASRT